MRKIRTASWTHKPTWSWSWSWCYQNKPRRHGRETQLANNVNTGSATPSQAVWGPNYLFFSYLVYISYISSATIIIFFYLVYILYTSSAASSHIREFFTRGRRGVSQIALSQISEFANGELANGERWLYTHESCSVLLRDKTDLPLL